MSGFGKYQEGKGWSDGDRDTYHRWKAPPAASATALGILFSLFFSLQPSPPCLAFVRRTSDSPLQLQCLRVPLVSRIGVRREMIAQKAYYEY